MNNKPVRKTQAIAPFGPGAIVDFPGPVSLMHAGLNVYPFDPGNPEHNEFKIVDDRRLARRVRAEYFVEPVDYREPKGGINYRNPYLKIPFVKFPLWHVCPRCGRMMKSDYHLSSSPYCEGPIGSGADSGKPHRKRKCFQVRFLTVCSQGHIADFPWERWLFDGEEWPTEKKHLDWIKGCRENKTDYWLRYRASGNAAASGIEISAEYKDRSTGQIKVVKRKVLGRIFSAPDSGPDNQDPENKVSPLGRQRIPIVCDGTNPVLGIGAAGDSPGCGAQLYVSLKNASNLYFPSVYSSIFIPILDDPDIPIAVKEIIDDFSVQTRLRDGALDSDDGLVGLKSVRRILRDLYPQHLNEETENGLFEAAKSPKILRMFLDMDSNVRDSMANLASTGTEPSIEDYARWAADLDWAINPELFLTEDRETENVIENPADEELQDEYFKHDEYVVFTQKTFYGMPKTHLHVAPQKIDDYPDWMRRYFKRISLIPKLRETRVFTGFNRLSSVNLDLEQRKTLFRGDSDIRWLPGTVVKGEGIFIEFDPQALDRWVSANTEKLKEKEGYLLNAKFRLRRHQSRDLISPVSAEFVLLHSFAHILINQLIYDSGYGSASLRERIYFSHRTPNRMSGILIFTAAGDTEGSMGGLVRLGESSYLPEIFRDSLIRASWCSSDPVCGESKGQGLFGGNLAACHACTLLPETSCEHMNLYLDRSMLVGTPEDPKLGFFSDLLDELAS
jgi:hypothetical protein